MPEDVVRYAQNILQEIEHSFSQTHQDSFFLRGCNLIVHSIDKNDYRQELYLKYCTAVLSNTDDAAWQQLAESVVQHLLKSENMHKSCFLHEIKALLDMGLKSQTNAIFDKMIRLGQAEGVRMMLERGASTQDEDEYGDTAFSLAEDHNTVHRLLEDNMKGKLIMVLLVIRDTYI